MQFQKKNKSYETKLNNSNIIFACFINSNSVLIKKYKKCIRTLKCLAGPKPAQLSNSVSEPFDYTRRVKDNTASVG